MRAHYISLSFSLSIYVLPIKASGAGDKSSVSLSRNTVMDSYESFKAALAYKSSKPFFPSIRARVELARSNGRVVIVGSEVSFLRAGGDRWNWKLSLESFEPVHGLSRIVLLVADYLTTATAINVEKLVHPEDDGRVMVQLLLNLCFYYQNLIENGKQAEAASLEERRSVGDRGVVESPVEILLGDFEDGSGGLDFSQTLDGFVNGLEDFKTLLAEKADLGRLFVATKALLKYSVDILACCQAFMCFNHPVWIRISRSENRPMSEDLGCVCDVLTSKLEACRREIYNI